MGGLRFRDVSFWEKKAPARNVPGLVRMGFTKVHGFPGFGSTNLSNPKDDKTKNDAMVNVYPLDCPKPIIILKTITNQENHSNPTQNPYRRVNEYVRVFASMTGICVSAFLNLQLHDKTGCAAT